jgi:hypothetical protein
VLSQIAMEHTVERQTDAPSIDAHNMVSGPTSWPSQWVCSMCFCAVYTFIVMSLSLFEPVRGGHASIPRRLLDEVSHSGTEDLHAQLPLALRARAVFWGGRTGGVVGLDHPRRNQSEH